MSRVGRRPVAIPAGVTVERTPDGVRVKGPKGTLSERLPEAIGVEIAGSQVVFARGDDKKDNRALHGLARALVANMVKGVVQPFVRELEIQGVGFRADVSGKTLNLSLGFSHPVEIPVPDGLKVSVDRNVIVRVEGIDRRQVGQFAADLRRIRPPEPYKGKGIRYLGEHVRRKVGKAATGSGTA
jgi:large subunit ribosomal protein L6